MKTLMLALPVALVVAATGCGYGQTPEERTLAHVDRALDAVDANDAQRETIRAATVAFSAELTEARAAQAVSRQKIIVELQGDKPDAKVVADEADLAVTSFASTAHAFVDVAGTVHSTLTPEQRARLTERMKPGRPMKAALFVAGRLGYGPPADDEEMRARANKGIERALSRVDATDAQKEALRPLALGLLDEAAPLLERREVLAGAFADAWASDKPDLASLHALVDVEAVRVGALARSAASRVVDAHQILTPEQREKIANRWGARRSSAKPSSAKP